jgi:hypothetical protein
MPRAAIQKGHANKIVPLESIGAYLVSQYGGGDRAPSEKSEKPDRSDRPEKVEKNDKNDKNDKNERTPVSSQRS